MDLDFQQWLIVALFVSLFFKEEAKSFIRAQMGLKTDNLQEGMDYLKMHFNDELTGILTELQVDQKHGFVTLKEKTDNLKELITKTNTVLDNFDRYGVPSRK